jgi:hypothetical protein
MESVRPLQDASEDLAGIFERIIQSSPLDTALVQKMLHCYRSWVDYAVRGEEVKVEILFPYKSHLSSPLTLVPWQM